MPNKTRVLLMIGLAGLLALAADARPGAPGTSVYLKASFQDAGDGSGMSSDKLRSDGKGPYKNGKGLTVMINGDGELVFDIGSSSGRRVNMIFDTWLRTGTSGELPPDPAGEPVTTAAFKTQMDSYYDGPKVNFLEMGDGDAAEVRIWIVFTTAVRNYFYLNYAQYGLAEKTGTVMVGAIDTEPKDGVVDRWVLTPKSSTNEMAYLNRQSYTGKNRKLCDIGDFRVPFMLTLDRL